MSIALLIKFNKFNKIVCVSNKAKASFIDLVENREVQVINNSNNDAVVKLYYKVNKLDGVFNIIDTATDAISTFSDKIVDGITTGLTKVFKRKKKGDKNE